MYYRSLLYVLYLSLLVTFVGPDSVRAGDQVTIHKIVQSEINPTRARMLIHAPGVAPTSVPAVLVSLDEEGNRWGLAAQFEQPPGWESFRYAFVLFGQDGEREIQAADEYFTGVEDGVPQSSQQIREQLMKEREALKSWKLQSDVQKESLRRLREDAELIANVGRIKSVREEIAFLEDMNLQVEHDIRVMTKLLKTAQSAPRPINYTKREQQLTQALSELAEAAKRAEEQEFERKSLTEDQIQGHLSLIEDTRDQDPELLTTVRRRLRRRRNMLEMRLGVDSNQALSHSEGPRQEE